MKQKCISRILAVMMILAILSGMMAVPVSARELQEYKDFAVTWFNPGNIISLDKGENVLTLNMQIHEKDATFYLAFPAIGGIRMYTDTTGIWEPDSLLPIAYAEKDGDLTASAGTEEKIVISDVAGDWLLQVQDKNGKTVFSLNRQQIAFGYDDENKLGKVRLIGNVSKNESLFGLGERFNSIVQNGNTVGMWNYDSYDDLVSLTGDKTKGYKNIPLLHSTEGYSIFFSSSYYCLADIADSNSHYYCLDFSGPIFDFYLWAGQPLENVESYTDLTGKSYVPPKWAFHFIAGQGQQYWQQNGLEQENYLGVLEDYLKSFQELGTPIAALYGELGVVRDYEAHKIMEKYGTRVIGWQNSELTTPASDMGVKLTESNWPVVHSILNPLLIQNGNYADFTDERTKDIFVQWLKTRTAWNLRGSMVDFADNVYEDSSFANGMKGSQMHNLYAYYYIKTINEAYREAIGSDDFLLYARAAAPGSQSYAGLFAGDHPVNFEGMKQSVMGGLNIGAAGYSVWGSDIGGLAPMEMPTEEVYIRWMQFGTFSPLMRTHGYTSRAPWDYGELAVENYLNHYWFRENMLDFIYGKALVSGQKGTPMMKSMALMYPDDEKLVKLTDQYIFCDELLVAPVMKENAYTREVVFPEGVWVNLWTGEKIRGGQTLVVDAPLDQIPVYIREGAMIPVTVAENLVLTDTMLDRETVKALIVTAGGEDREMVHYLDETTSVAFTSGKTEDGAYRFTVNGDEKYPVVYAYGITAEAVTADGKQLQKLDGMPTDGEGYYVDMLNNRTVIRCEDWTQLLVTDSGTALEELAENKTVADGNEKKATVLDNDSKTYWKVLEKDSAITVDLTENKTVSALTLKWTSRAPASYTVETSVDNENWEAAYATDSSLGNVEKISFEPRQAQYVRIRDIKKAKDSRYSPELYKLEIYGDQLVQPEDPAEPTQPEELAPTEPVAGNEKFENDPQIIWLLIAGLSVVVLAVAVSVLAVKKRKAGK